MLLKLICSLSIALALPSLATAQSSVRFNLFSLEGAYVSRVFNFDAGYSEKYGIPVPAPFGLKIPIHKDIKLIADGQPDGGFVKFTFATQGEPRKFIENFHVIDMTIGMAEDQAVRINTLAQLIEKKALPMAVKGFSDVKLVGMRQTQVNGIAAVELVATYTDPSIGPMVLQIVGLLNQNAPESYLVLHNLSLAMAPLSGVDQLPDSLGGRVLASFSYK